MAKFRVFYITTKVAEVEADNMDEALAEAVTMDTSDESVWIEAEDDYVLEEITEG